MQFPLIPQRRRFLGGAAVTASGLLLFSCGKESEEKSEEEVSPAEDLMREHGVLKRVLLVYREAVRRIDAKQDLPVDVVTSGATLIRKFIEDYHEKLEEEHLFPRFRKADKMVELVDILEEQHRKGRDVTAAILQSAGSGATAQDPMKLKESLQAFVRMYEPHEAREDTELFPAFRKIVSKHEYDALGEDFEKKEHELFGEDGFERNVVEVARLEQALGINDLRQFTPA